MTTFDALVVGAGIQGAGVAQALAASGYSVLVVERNHAPGLETSSNSSKLIHGGLRYLETGQFKLVRECLRERGFLLARAPDLVTLKPFYLPVYRHSRRSPWWIAAGLSVYRLLGGLHWRRLPQHQWSALGIQTRELRAVFQYYDAQTDDRALAQAVLASAVEQGAEVVFGTELLGAQCNAHWQARLDDGRCVRARALINTAGPWVNQVASLIEGAPLADIDWVQGVHLVVARAAPPGCLYVEAPSDGRAVFILPWYGQTMIGTTERTLQSPNAKASEQEIDYLLEIYNHYSSAAPCSRQDVCKVMAGVRVLPAGDTQATRRSREILITEARSQEALYLGLYGGKLTSYRATAEKILAKVAAAWGEPCVCPTREMSLRMPPFSESGTGESAKDFAEAVAAQKSEQPNNVERE